jgi:type VI secretion system protein ImpH
MAGPPGQPDHRLSAVVANDPTRVPEALLARLKETPWAFDFYQALRRIEAATPALPRLGEARRPADEPIRLGQRPELTFAPSSLDGATDAAGGRLRLSVQFLGLWGPNGPLPLHLTEVARERARSHGDTTLTAFADVFHHRLLLLFYRAWRAAQPAASHDRPQADRFRLYLGALFGQGGAPWHARDALSDEVKRHQAGHLGRGPRNADGLADLLRHDLRVPVEVLCFVPDWLALPQAQRSRLGRRGSVALGQGAVLGARVRDAQHQIEIRIGPLSAERYRSFLPGSPSLTRLRDWVRTYTNDEYRWRVRLLLRRDAVEPAVLGRQGRLGLTSWLPDPRRSRDAADLLLTAESIDRAVPPVPLRT